MLQTVGDKGLKFREEVVLMINLLESSSRRSWLMYGKFILFYT